MILFRSSQFTVGVTNKTCNVTPVVLEARKYQQSYSDDRNCAVDDVGLEEIVYVKIGPANKVLTTNN